MLWTISLECFCDSIPCCFIDLWNQKGKKGWLLGYTRRNQATFTKVKDQTFYYLAFSKGFSLYFTCLCRQCFLNRNFVSYYFSRVTDHATSMFIFQSTVQLFWQNALIKLLLVLHQFTFSCPSFFTLLLTRCCYHHHE